MLFLHFATPKWELEIMFAVSHLRCGARVQLSVHSPILSCSFAWLGVEVMWPFLSGHKYNLKWQHVFSTELFKFYVHAVNVKGTYLKHFFCEMADVGKD